MITEAKLNAKRWGKELSRRHVAHMAARHGPKQVRLNHGNRVNISMKFDEGSISIAPVKAAPKQGILKRMTSWMSRKRG